ncbi:hypothetical protein BC830DRAFT_1114502 [Chytriomyces sp. MP71]|nr:hypothetical protein BC830DRAFT_1114502 [Chytriomyces sp. MP71]
MKFETASLILATTVVVTADPSFRDRHRKASRPHQAKTPKAYHHRQSSAGMGSKLMLAAAQDPVCSGNNWDRGDAVDPDAPPKPWPVAGQQVYIQDPQNFCINLPNPNDQYLIDNYWSKGVNPTFVNAEGHVQAFCVGKLAPGALPMPDGAITSVHILKNQSKGGKAYHQITGGLNCQALKMNCEGDNGGQYDSVPYRNCGKEPYSGVDETMNPGFSDYVEIGGSYTYCMRTCVAGQIDGDPCTAKDDSLGCAVLMDGTDDYSSGFWMSDPNLDGGKPVAWTMNTSAVASATSTSSAVVAPSSRSTTEVSTTAVTASSTTRPSSGPAPTSSPAPTGSSALPTSAAVASSSGLANLVPSSKSGGGLLPVVGSILAIVVLLSL